MLLDRIQSIDIYETKTRLYLIGKSQHQNYSVLKIDKTSIDLQFQIDSVEYSDLQIQQLLLVLAEGNKNSGGFKKIFSTQKGGLIGFVRFLQGWYLYLIKSCSAIAKVGGNDFYQIDETALLPVCKPTEKYPEEQKFMDLFLNVDLRKNFYFSYSYNLTLTLQRNIQKENHLQEMFIWNYALLQNGFETISLENKWILPIIHGFLEQIKIPSLSRPILITLIARRSRHFAGTRFLKRGITNSGYCANEVETEQIVSIHPTTFASHLSSYVQHRASIPLFWSQDTASNSTTPSQPPVTSSAVSSRTSSGSFSTALFTGRPSSPASSHERNRSISLSGSSFISTGKYAKLAKPPIRLELSDPFFSSTARHFNQLMKRYGCPIIILNLVKQKENTPRESILLNEYTQAVTYLNQFLPDDKKMKYIAFDMSRAAKSRDQNVIGLLERIAQETFKKTLFFHSGSESYLNALLYRNQNDKISFRETAQLQRGIVRTNCIDCLDRTNAAQFILGKCALSHQLFAMGVLNQPDLPMNCDAVKMVMQLYHDHGDILALQYGGSALVNTMETYQKKNVWSSQSRDMIETIKRYYSNQFTDAEKQDAINLFLGHFNPDRPRKKKPTDRKSYIYWYDQENLENLVAETELKLNLDFQASYSPHQLTCFQDQFLFQLSSQQSQNAADPQYSPFTVPVKHKESKEDLKQDESASTLPAILHQKSIPNSAIFAPPLSHVSEPVSPTLPASTAATPVQKRPFSLQMPTSVLVPLLLEPSVSQQEQLEYQSYIEQFQFKTNGNILEKKSEEYNESYYKEYLENPFHETEEKDLKIFEKYVNHPTMLLKNVHQSHQHHVSYDGYKRWLKTGKYSVQPFL